MHSQSPVAIASNHDLAAILITNIRAVANTIMAVKVADSSPVSRNTFTMRSGIAVTVVWMVMEL
ncbi:hypothetical protein BOTCAL_0153g00080 [Botryotinia calthae]|uniref:Uncharacterized protein n=1 Tax=Botryotinia calthae TaxID=38488 RepID=A0A4Y8D277_9HELO|nr:hypothetical protein BOTCAL_0153g00080 [Botryotinia calthae]